MNVTSRSLHQKYRQLLIVLVANFCVSPFLKVGIESLASAFLLFYTLIVIIRSFSLPKFLVSVYTAIAFIAFFLQISAIMGWLAFPEQSLELVPQVIFVIYLGAAAYWIGRDIFTTSRVTLDTVQGGISIYLLIGYVWALFYSMISTLDADAFSQSLLARGYFLQSLYFSFTTLTTLGYGDIVPVSDVALVFSNLEAIMGQMYSTVFIAILVGGYLAQHSNNHQ
ncbi:MAG: potassium channel family protein [Cyanobacteria bacterium J06627_8]